MSRDIPLPKPTDRQRLEVRRLLRGARAATLATRMADGAPYASLVTMATDHAGRPLLLLSGLAEHTRHLDADGRCALLVEAASDLPNPQTGPRITVMARAGRIREETDHAPLLARFLARHPGAALYAGFGDFGLWRLEVERVHFVGGFARAVWIDDGILLPEARAAAFADSEPGILAHMNQDHAQAVSDYASGLLGMTPGPWRLAAIDADGLDMVRDEVAPSSDGTRDETGDGPEDGPRDGTARGYRLAFDPPLAAPTEARERLVALAREARRTH